MKITILNGNPCTDNLTFDNYLQELSQRLEASQHSVSSFKLRDMNIKYCTGCFGCWVKTPGECVTKDDSATIRHEYINSDFVLFASPVIMGFISAVLKKTQDKLIPLLLPYFEMVHGEVHHQRRYDNYPRIGLLLEKGSDTDEEDIEIISDIYGRTAINLKTSFCFSRLTSDPVEEVANEINSI